MTNTHATAAAYVTLLKLTANRAYHAPDPTSCQAGDAASQTAHGLRAHTVDCRFIDHYEAARAAADARLADRRRPRARLALTIPAGSSANLAQVVHRTLSDRITVVGSNPVINADFYIEGMELKATARTGHLTARWQVKEA